MHEKWPLHEHGLCFRAATSRGCSVISSLLYHLLPNRVFAEASLSHSAVSFELSQYPFDLVRRSHPIPHLPARFILQQPVEFNIRLVYRLSLAGPLRSESKILTAKGMPHYSYLLGWLSLLRANIFRFLTTLAVEEDSNASGTNNTQQPTESTQPNNNVTEESALLKSTRSMELELHYQQLLERRILALENQLASGEPVEV